MTPDYREDRLAKLRAQTADRPAHARFLEETIRLYEAGKANTDWPSETSIRGVSGRVQDAIEHDVHAAFTNAPGFGDYNERRVADLRAAHERRRTADSLASLLRL